MEVQNVNGVGGTRSMGNFSGEEVEPAGDGTTKGQIQKFCKRARKAFATVAYPSETNSYRSFALQRQPKKLGISLKVTIKLGLFLGKKYFSAAMVESDEMLEHINRMKSLARQLKSVGPADTEDDQVATLLCSLLDSHSKLIIAFKSRSEDLTMFFLVVRLSHEEQKRKGDIALSDTTEKAMISFKEQSKE